MQPIKRNLDEEQKMRIILKIATDLTKNFVWIFQVLLWIFIECDIRATLWFMNGIHFLCVFTPLQDDCLSLKLSIYSTTPIV